MIFIKILIIIFFVVGGCSFIYSLYKYIAVSREFRDYLLKINDKETLIKIGRLNSQDEDIFSNEPIYQVDDILVDDVLTEKYEQTKDEVYLMYNEENRHYVTRIRILAITLFIALAVFMIITKK